MSREEADQKDKEIRSDDIRLKMALDESQDVSFFKCTVKPALQRPHLLFPLKMVSQ